MVTTNVRDKKGWETTQLIASDEVGGTRWLLETFDKVAEGNTKARPPQIAGQMFAWLESKHFLPSSWHMMIFETGQYKMETVQFRITERLVIMRTLAIHSKSWLTVS